MEFSNECKPPPIINLLNLHIVYQSTQYQKWN
jgi:hypothetical protein